LGGGRLGMSVEQLPRVEESYGIQHQTTEKKSVNMSRSLYTPSQPGSGMRSKTPGIGGVFNT